MNETKQDTITLYRGTDACTVTIDPDGFLSIHGVGDPPSLAEIEATAPGLVEQARRIRVAHRRQHYPGATVVATVAPDDTGVGAVAYVERVDLARPVPRRADEGGTFHGGGHYPFLAAVLEAEERARRCADVGDICREGYTLADYRDARARLQGADR